MPKFSWEATDAAGIDWDDDDDDEVTEARGAQRGNDTLKNYWIHGKGLARWRGAPHPWTALYEHLRRHVPDEQAKQFASSWFHEVFGIWPGERKGENPTGKG